MVYKGRRAWVKGQGRGGTCDLLLLETFHNQTMHRDENLLIYNFICIYFFMLRESTNSCFPDYHKLIIRNNQIENQNWFYQKMPNLKVLLVKWNSSWNQLKKSKSNQKNFSSWEKCRLVSRLINYNKGHLYFNGFR